VNQTYTSNSIKIYPNPVKNELFIETDESLLENTVVELINTTGRVFFKAKLNSTNVIQTSHLSQGIYLLKITSGNISRYNKIIKQ